MVNFEEGDHIFWYRFLGYTHHAIVEEVNNDGSIDVIEFGKSDGVFRVQRLNTDVINAVRVEYPSGSLQPERVLETARSFLEPGPNTFGTYHLLTNNCEHFATYCKTGNKQSTQVISLIKNVLFSLKDLCKQHLPKILVKLDEFLKSLFDLQVKPSDLLVSKFPELVKFSKTLNELFQIPGNKEIVLNFFISVISVLKGKINYETIFSEVLGLAQFMLSRIVGSYGSEEIGHLLGELIGSHLAGPVGMAAGGAIGAVAGHIIGTVVVGAIRWTYSFFFLNK